MGGSRLDLCAFRCLCLELGVFEELGSDEDTCGDRNGTSFLFGRLHLDGLVLDFEGPATGEVVSGESDIGKANIGESDFGALGAFGTEEDFEEPAFVVFEFDVLDLEIPDFDALDFAVLDFDAPAFGALDPSDVFLDFLSMDILLELAPILDLSSIVPKSSEWALEYLADLFCFVLALRLQI